MYLQRILKNHEKYKCTHEILQEGGNGIFRWTFRDYPAAKYQVRPILLLSSKLEPS